MSLRPLFPALHSVVSDIQTSFSDIPDERKVILEEIAAWVAEKQRDGAKADMIFICTHNSRRSHMSQIWAQAAAWMHGLDHVRTWSGGTEATAFNSRAVKALQDCGFRITVAQEGDNPLYHVAFADNAGPIEAFSKAYHHSFNPQEDFAAVMTCSDADEACPVVLGAAKRFATPYRDPKEFDGTPQEEHMYAERCRQIAGEVIYIMDRAAGMLAQ
ncbi:MAG: protein-tyrosine-phosphatase [Bacteroidetes bacterium]|nr:protein-tyrosine-phosphatase [Bacteroidota bacterium]